MVGIATILLIIVLERTRLKSFGIVVALIVASVLVPLFDWDSVALVSDIAEIPDSLPLPTLPPLSVFPALIIPAVSLALVGLVQGAGVSQNYVNPDGNYPDPSGDFIGQGAGNLAAGLFQGMPVGGSLSATALVHSSGAKSRFANIFAGITIVIALLLFGTAIGALAMPALAGLLIVVGFGTLKINEINLVWKTGTVQRAVMVITFIFTLLIPLQFAVLIGVALARSLLNDPAIFILDEATASVDPFTEALIQEGLEPIMQDRTAIVIAHRLSTAKHADRIIVMESGRIIETGNHDHLMAQGGHYAELYNTYFRHQSVEYIDEAKWRDDLEPRETAAK